MDCSMPGFSVLHYVLEFAQTHAHCVYHLILCCNLLLLPSIFPSIKVFSNELALYIRWPKYWSFRFRISPSSEYLELFPLGLTGLISLKSKGLKSLLQHHNQKHQFFNPQPSLCMVYLSHPHTTARKTIALIIWTSVSKVMSLLFNTLSRFVIVFFQGASVLISWFQSLYAVILEPKKRKSVTVSTFPPSICYEVMGLDAMILVFSCHEFQASFVTLLSPPHQEAL